MIARGDTYEMIKAQTGIKHDTDLTNIKRRNPDTLRILNEKVETYRRNKASKLLDKSHNLLDRKLDMLAEDDEKLDSTKPSELVAVSKEMHLQAKGDEGEIVNPADQAQLEDVMRALKEGDEIELQRIVFKKNESDSISEAPFHTLSDH